MRAAGWKRVVGLASGSLACAPPAAPLAVPRIDLSEHEEPQSHPEPVARESSGLIAAQPLGPGPGDDSEFVYSRSPGDPETAHTEQLELHIQEEWWPFRSAFLGISVKRAQSRDEKVSGKRAPEGFWDEQTAVEAASVWTVLCNECHGGRRSAADALAMPPPEEWWSEREGIFFGNARSHGEMFGRVDKGGPVRDDGRQEMPRWQGILSREMIWALLYFLEYQSGGLETRSPPSLYPRRPAMMGHLGPHGRPPDP